MPQTVVFSIKTAFEDGGPKIPEVKRTNKVSANISIMEEVPNDKNWHEFDVMGGTREQVGFVMVAADQYQDEHCPRVDEPGLLFKFDDSDFAMQLDGPLLYSGHTASCLPPKVDRIWIQNRMAENVKFYFLLGRKEKKKDDENGQANEPATTPAAQ